MLSSFRIISAGRYWHRGCNPKTLDSPPAPTSRSLRALTRIPRLPTIHPTNDYCIHFTLILLFFSSAICLHIPIPIPYSSPVDSILYSNTRLHTILPERRAQCPPISPARPQPTNPTLAIPAQLLLTEPRGKPTPRISAKPLCYFIRAQDYHDIATNRIASVSRRYRLSPAAGARLSVVELNDKKRERIRPSLHTSALTSVRPRLIARTGRVEHIGRPLQLSDDEEPHRSLRP